MRPRLIVFLGLAITFLGPIRGTNAGAGPGPAPGKLNVLFIVSDDLNNRPGLLRPPAGQVAEHRPARPPGRALRPGLLPVPAVQPQPGLLPHRPAARHHRRPRERHPVPQERAGRRDPAADCSSKARLLRGPGRQAVPLRRAGPDRHRRPGRPAVVGAGRQPPGPGQGRRGQDLQLSRPGSGFGGTLSWLAADGTDEEQTDGRSAADAASGCWRSTTTGRSSWPSASSGRTPPTSPRRSTSTCTRRIGSNWPEDPADDRVRHPGAGPDGQPAELRHRRGPPATGDPGLPRLDQLHGRPGRPAARRPGPSGPSRTNRRSVQSGAIGRWTLYLGMSRARTRRSARRSRTCTRARCAPTPRRRRSPRGTCTVRDVGELRVVAPAREPRPSRARPAARTPTR